MAILTTISVYLVVADFNGFSILFVLKTLILAFMVFVSLKNVNFTALFKKN